MFVTISIMFIAAAACIMTFIIAAPRATPVLPGQRWHLPGLGTVLIVEANIKSSKTPSIKYQLPNGDFGFCTKRDVQYTGRLLPHCKKAQREMYIENILRDAKEKNHRNINSWKPYTSPPGWQRPPKDDIVYDAEIIEPSSKARPDKNVKKNKKNLSISKDDDFTHF